MIVRERMRTHVNVKSALAQKRTLCCFECTSARSRWLCVALCRATPEQKGIPGCVDVAILRHQALSLACLGASITVLAGNYIVHQLAPIHDWEVQCLM